MIDVSAHSLELIQKILSKHVPDCEVRAFGSRVTWTAKDYSDLDLAIVGKEKLAQKTLPAIKDDFKESDLPIRVDVLDWNAISKEFKKVIEKKYEVIQKAPGLSKKSGIPEGWEEVSLGDICQLRAGSAFKLELQGQTSGDYPFIKVSDMNLSGNEICIHFANNWISEADCKTLRANLHPAGATAFAKIGIALTYNRRRILVRDTVIDNNMMSAIPDVNRVDPKFLYYLLCLQDFNRISDGSALPFLSVNALKKISLIMPQLSEQRATAKILSDLDAKIELNHQMNKTLEQISQAIFKRWFVDFKFQGHEKVKFVNGLPEGWAEKPLDEIAEFLNGLALQKFPPTGDAWLPVVKIRELNQGITEASDKASLEIDPAYIVDDGDVIFSWSGSLNVVLWGHGRGALNQHLFKVTSQQYPKWFYYFWIKEYLLDFRLIAEGKATTMGHIQRHHLSQAMVWVPNKEELQVLNSVIEPLVDRVISNLIEIRQLRQIRDSLLPKMMSGKIRVNKKG